MKENLFTYSSIKHFVFPHAFFAEFSAATCCAVQTSVYSGRTDISAQTEDFTFSDNKRRELLVFWYQAEK